jgi:N-glycosidase YbiA
MLEALRAKFTLHEELNAILLGTGDAVLVEHTANDSYWGDGGDGSGKNRL